jgi:hypothetical protein
MLVLRLHTASALVLKIDGVLSWDIGGLLAAPRQQVVGGHVSAVRKANVTVNVGAAVPMSFLHVFREIRAPFADGDRTQHLPNLMTF